MATAIQDRLFLGIIEAKEFLGLSTIYSSVTIEILNVLPSTAYRLTIGTAQVSYTSDSTPTSGEIVSGIVGAIAAAAIPGITATAGSGQYAITGTSPFQLWPGDHQDVVPTVSQDYLVESLIAVSKQLADDYCMNQFPVTDYYGRWLNSSGEIVTEIEDAALADIPDAVKFGVKLLLKQLYYQYNSSALVSGISGPITHIRVGDQTITSSPSSGSSGSYDGSGILSDLARNTLAPYKVYFTAEYTPEESYNVEQD